jgi:hypothetical protein
MLRKAIVSYPDQFKAAFIHSYLFLMILGDCFAQGMLNFLENRLRKN